MAYVLFAGRAELPAAAFFYQLRSNGKSPVGERERILTFAPLVTNQEPNRPIRFNRKVDTWTIIVNGSEIREVDLADAIKGDALTWKLAMWGSHRDRRLLEAVAKRFPTLAEEQEDRKLTILQGFELRDKRHEQEKILFQELVGKDELLPKRIRERGPMFAFPPDALKPISRDRAYLRTRGGKTPIQICKPPHVIVQASRNYAVFSERFIVVPPRQVGIAGPNAQADFLRVLSLYLSSDFAKYHQFLLSPQWGVFVNVSTLDTLKALPVPNWDAPTLSEWLDLHLRLVQVSAKALKKGDRSKRSGTAKGQRRFGFDTNDSPDPLAGLMKELNDRVYQLLAFRETEQLLVEDFIGCKRFAAKGKVTEEAARRPDPTELQCYGKALQSELDDFFEDQAQLRHKVNVLYDEISRTGMVEVQLLKNHRGPLPVKVERADAGVSSDFEGLRQQVREKRSQWLYFERNLRIYEASRTLLLKPLQRIHWLRSQALLDADTIIAEMLATGGK
jgi:hypothetical protein